MTGNLGTTFWMKLFKQALLRNSGLKSLIVLQESVLVEFFEESLCPYVSPCPIYTLYRIASQSHNKIFGK